MGRWFVSFSRNVRAKQRLFCFPYAGGSAHLFRGWQDAMPSEVEVLGVQMPGKGARVLEPPCTSLGAGVAGLLDAIRPLVFDRPYSFFGHSNGALISFELTRQLHRQGMPLPRQLLLSANPAPWTRTFEKPVSGMTDEEFKLRLLDLNGTPPEILENEELLALMLPGLRADFELAETYLPADSQPVNVPTTVFYGEHDEIPLERIRAWQDGIAGTVEYKVIPGGHFYVNTHRDLMVAEVRRRLGYPSQSDRPDATVASGPSAHEDRHAAGEPQQHTIMESGNEW
jgi:medium-chain acyl-[acyl-carrier-protein] hydrolase